MTKFAVKHTNGSFHTTRVITSAAPMCNFTLIIQEVSLFDTFGEAKLLANRLNKTDHNWFVTRIDPWTTNTSKILNV